jgi:MFS family permease
VLQAMSGVGGLAGGLIVANLDKYPRKGRLMFFASMFTGVFLIAFALSPWFGVALPMLAGVGLASMIFMTVNNTVITAVIPDHVRGRVMSVMMMSFGLMPLGAVPASIAAEFVGTPIVVAVGGLLLMVAVALFYAMYPAFRTLDGVIQTERANREAEHAASIARTPAAAGR